MKRIIILILALVMVATLSLSGCGSYNVTIGPADEGGYTVDIKPLDDNTTASIQSLDPTTLEPVSAPVPEPAVPGIAPILPPEPREEPEMSAPTPELLEEPGPVSLFNAGQIEAVLRQYYEALNSYDLDQAEELIAEQCPDSTWILFDIGMARRTNLKVEFMSMSYPEYLEVSEDQVLVVVELAIVECDVDVNNKSITSGVSRWVLVPEDGDWKLTWKSCHWERLVVQE